MVGPRKKTKSGFGGRRKSRTQFAGGLIILLLACFSVGKDVAAGISGHASHPHVHKKYAHLKNPVPMTEQSIQAGKTVFEKYCVACHGKDARGGIGPDLADEQWTHGPSDGEIFHVISDGVAGTSMKEFKDVLSEEMRWDLVNYIRSSGKKRNK